MQYDKEYKMNTSTTVAEFLHDAQSKSEQIAEELGKIHALANLMNAHTGYLTVAEITNIFSQNKPLAAHLICKRFISNS
jgi:hypothetical protein